MKRSLLIAVLLVMGVAGLLAGVKVLQIRKLIAAGKAYAPPPETVSTAVAQTEQWPSTLRAIGSITPVQGVNVTPDLPGTVREIAFDSGAVVPAGALLVRLDTSSEEAELRAVEAQVELARLNADRARTLRAENMVPQSELDTAEASLKQAQAQADTIRATIGKKTLRAPFAGRLGIRQINLGQYVEAGKPIVSLQSLTPIYVDFSLPQQQLAQLKTGMTVQVTTDAYPGKLFHGTLTAINPDLDPATRSVGLQATLENPDQALRPGMFARAEVVLPQVEQALVVPATAILSAPYGDSVFLVETAPSAAGGGATLVVRQQFVRTGRALGDYVSVLSGLKPGDRVASSGVFKLRNGMAVVENNTLVPASTEAPRPKEG